jgi:hypothetical protein
MTVAPEHPLANRKFERAEPQLPVNRGIRHVSAQNDGFLWLCMPKVGRQIPQLCARKVGPNEARSLSDTFGKDELNLGIAQSPSTRRVELNLVPPRPQRAAEAACAG